MKDAPTLPLRSYALPPLVLSLSSHNAYLFAFLEDQFPKLACLGYKALLIERQDPLIEKKKIKCFTAFILGIETPEFMTKHLLEYANTYNGGVIFILNSGKIHAAYMQEILTKESAIPCQFFADLANSDPSLNAPVHFIGPGPSCFRNFWKPIEDFLINNKKNISYSYAQDSPFEARLKRIAEEFEIVKDQNEKEHGLLVINNTDPFHTLSTAIEKKLGIMPLLQWTIINNSKCSDSKFSLVVPHLSNAKTKPSSFKKKSEIENDQFRVEIMYWLKNASKKTNFKFNSSIQRWSLKLPFGEEISLDQGFIVQMELIYINKVTDDPQDGFKNLDPIEVILVLILRNKKPLVCSLAIDNKVGTYTQSANKKRAQAMRKLFTDRGSQADNSFSCQNHHDHFKWESTHYSNFYDEVTTNYYLSAHHSISNYLIDIVPHSREITLFSFGCGDGKELITLKKTLQNNGFNVSSLIGFDINSENFDLNKMSEIHYVQGDLSFLKPLLDSTPSDKNTFKVGLFLGSLVLGCMRGTYHALNVLQQARTMDTIILCGYTPILLNKEILKAAGYQVKASEFSIQHSLSAYDETLKDTSETFFHLTPMLPFQRKAFLLKRSTNRSNQGMFDCLDLSLSAYPYVDLSHFSVAALEYVDQVDISWSYFQEEEIMPFFKKLAALNKPLDILISRNQLLFERIQIEVRHYPSMTLIERLDVVDQHECPIFSPQIAKNLGIYKQLPTKKL